MTSASELAWFDSSATCLGAALIGLSLISSIAPSDRLRKTCAFSPDQLRRAAAVPVYAVADRAESRRAAPEVLLTGPVPAASICRMGFRAMRLGAVNRWAW